MFRKFNAPKRRIRGGSIEALDQLVFFSSCGGGEICQTMYVVPVVIGPMSPRRDRRLQVQALSPYATDTFLTGVLNIFGKRYNNPDIRGILFAHVQDPWRQENRKRKEASKPSTASARDDTRAKHNKN
jgi:hypothetical protein